MSLRFTLQKLRHLPPRIGKRLRSQGPGNTWAWFCYQLSWRRRERQLGINTAEHAYGLDVYGVGDGQYYEPIDHRCFDAVLDYLNPNPQRDVFLDYGCGLGRAVILAAMRPFRRVIGVEVNEQLVELCRRHVESVRSRRKLRCGVEIVQQDAAAYAVPHDVNRVFMFNAFVGDLLQVVLEQIRKSLAERPRDLVLVYAPLIRHETLLADCPWLRLRCELPAAFWSHIRILVYEARLDDAPRAAADARPASCEREPTALAGGGGDIARSG